MEFDSFKLRTLYRDAQLVAQYGEYFGLAYGQMVTMWEDSDEMAAEFRDYPVEYTVLRLVSGSLPRLAYQGGDIDEALKAYGETVAQEHKRKAERSRW